MFTGDQSDFGGKARGLLRLAAHGIPTPPWIVIPSASAIERPWQDADRFCQWLTETLPSPNGRYIARSSAAAEDSETSSQAGVFRSVVFSRATAGPALDEVLRSAETSRGTEPMAIIIQVHLTAVTSGVMSSCNPNEAAFDEYYCESVYGDCARLVDGSHVPSSFRIDITDGTLVGCSSGADGPAVLDPGITATLGNWIRILEQTTGLPQDIEWLHDDRQLWCLQCRPLTSLTLRSDLSPPVCATSWFFDQRFQKPITPITRTTLIPQIIRASIHDPLAMLGFTDLPQPFYYGGQIYLPHAAYARMFSGFPHFLLTPDLRQLFPSACYCVQRPGWSIAHGLSGLPRIVLSLFRQRQTALKTIAAWDTFRSRIAERLAPFEKPPDPADLTAWTAGWSSLCCMTDEFLAIHRWSIFFADFSFNSVRSIAKLIPARWRDRFISRLTRGLALPTCEANLQRMEFSAGRLSDRQQQEFLTNYGHRSGSLDLAEPTWAEQADRDPAGSIPKSGISIPRRSLLRRHLELREEQRFEWERILAIQRRMLRDAGGCLSRCGRLEAPGDVWFLEWRELMDLLHNEQTAGEVTKRIARRKHEMAVSRAARKPSFIGPGHLSDPVRRQASSELRGLGVSSGPAKGTVFVHDAPMEFDMHIPQDCILVLRCLDPAWTWILPSVRGLILERGGLLSHAAMMAREYNLPTITNLQDATAILKTGMKVSIHGDTGIITIEQA